MKNRLFRWFVAIALVGLIGLTPNAVQAQCPMCRMSAETNLANGGSEGKGLNQGILYLLATPYIIVGIGGFIWYRNRNRRDEEVEDRYADLPEA